MMVRQGNREFQSAKLGGITVFKLVSINGEPYRTRGRKYSYVQCPDCGKIIGTQFRGDLRHYKTHNPSPSK